MSNASSGKLVILSAPSAGGKTTVVNELLKKYPEWTRSISATTRKPREGEVDGVDYFFLTPEEFDQKKDAGNFLESANVFDHQYGTPKDYVVSEIENDHILLLAIDVQGAIHIQKNWEKSENLVTIFILPPSIEVLRERLENRGSETPEQIQLRLETATSEIEQAKFYQHTVVNQNLDQTVSDIEKIILGKE